MVVGVLDLAPLHDHHVLALVSACTQRGEKLTPWPSVRFRILPPLTPSLERACLIAFMWLLLLALRVAFGRNDMVAGAPSDRAATTGPRPGNRSALLPSLQLQVPPTRLAIVVPGHLLPLPVRHRQNLIKVNMRAQYTSHALLDARVSSAVRLTLLTTLMPPSHTEDSPRTSSSASPRCTCSLRQS